LDLSVLDEIKIEGKAAVGVLAKTEGQGKHKKLYFDKTSGLLVKVESSTFRPGGQQDLSEVYYRDYEERDGLKHYRRISAFVNGVLAQEVTVTELEFFDKLDPKVFAKP
jgi:hypothetical protein